MKVFRWAAIIPLLILLIGLAVVWWLVADRVVANTVEDFGADVVGAKVDVAAADLRLGEGKVSLVGLAVANPDAPMRNLLEAQEVVADIRMKPLLTRKLVIEHVALRGVQFGTPRATSGALEGGDPESGRLIRQVTEWTRSVRIPPLNLQGIGAVVNVAGISPDSLRTLALGRSIIGRTDSARLGWERELRALNPVPAADSARLLAERLRTANPLRLGVTGVTELVGSGRRTLGSITELGHRLTALDSSVQQGVRDFRRDLEQLDATRREDYAYARRLLKIPSLDTPDLTPPAMTQAAVNRFAPILYWVHRVADVLPPGLDPRRMAGRNRARRDGTTVLFPKPGEYPRFLLELAEADFAIGGSGAAAGQYAGKVSGLTTTPALYGEPLEITAGRVRAGSTVDVHAILDHRTRPIRDTLRFSLSGLRLPSIDVPSLQVHLNMGSGTSDLSMIRVGESLAGRWRWRSDDVTWDRRPAVADTGVANQVRARVEDLLWRTVSAVRRIDLEARISGTTTDPTFQVTSNVGRVLAQALRDELGREVARAEQQLRAEVDRLVASGTRTVRAKVDTLETQLAARVGADRARVSEVREQLEAELRKLTRGVIP